MSELDAFASKGDVSYRLGKFNKAIEYYDKYLEEYPLDIYILSNKATLLRILGQSEKAALCYNKIYQVDPQFFRAGIDIISNSISPCVVADVIDFDEKFKENYSQDNDFNCDYQEEVEGPYVYQIEYDDEYEPDPIKSADLGDYDLFNYDIDSDDDLAFEKQQKLIVDFSGMDVYCDYVDVPCEPMEKEDFIDEELLKQESDNEAYNILMAQDLAKQQEDEELLDEFVKDRLIQEENDWRIYLKVLQIGVSKN